MFPKEIYQVESCSLEEMGIHYRVSEQLVEEKFWEAWKVVVSQEV